MKMKDKKAKVEKFDTLWHEVVVSGDKMVTLANGVRRNVRAFRRRAHRFTVAYLKLEQQHHNRLLQQVKSTHKSVEDWLDDHYAMVEEMGDRRQQLMAAVEAGVSETKYAEQGEVWLIAKRSKAKIRVPATTAAAPADVDSKKLTPEDVIEHLTARCASLSSELQGLKHDYAEMKRDMARVLRENERQVKAINRAERLLEGAREKQESAT
jgi:predicted site-specific integrase-resolvase